MPPPDSPGSADVDLSVVIPTYNRAADLADLLGCLADQQLRPGLSWEVIVVDNGSIDTTQSVLRDWSGRLPLRVECEPVRGSSAARNRGVRAARGALIVFADSDVLVGPQWLQSFADAASTYPDCAYFGGLLRNRYEHPPPSWYVGVGQGSLSFTQAGSAPRPASHVCGANWACRAAPLRSAGSFDVRLGPADLPANERRIVGNDADLMDRLVAAGYQGLLVPTPEGSAETRVSAAEMRLAYVTGWYFGYGRGQALRSTTPCATVFGLPRWRVRRGLTDGARLLGALARRDRRMAVRLLVRVAASAGYLYESAKSRP